ncbi:hypothetical protein AAHE18_16G194200 [Arachis hypogaea]
MVACVEGCGEGFCGRQSNLRGEFLVRKMHGVGTFAGANKDTYKGSWTHNLQEEPVGGCDCLSSRENPTQIQEHFQKLMNNIILINNCYMR